MQDSRSMRRVVAANTDSTLLSSSTEWSNLKGSRHAGERPRGKGEWSRVLWESPQGKGVARPRWKLQILVPSKWSAVAGKGGWEENFVPRIQEGLWTVRMTHDTLDTVATRVMTVRGPQTCLLGWTKSVWPGTCSLAPISLVFQSCFPPAAWVVVLSHHQTIIVVYSFLLHFATKF